MSREPFEILHRISSAISEASRLEEIYEIILREIMEVMDVERASIMRFDPASQVLRIVAARGLDKEVWNNVEISVGEGVSGRVWQEGKPLLIKKIRGNPRYKTHSYMIAPVTSFPMKVGHVPIGLINLTDKKSGKPFTDSDLKLLMTLSDQVASYMHIYDLVDRLKVAEEARLQLEVARSIQQRLLPRKPPFIQGLEMEGCLITAERVGADYYDYLPIDDGDGLGFCIADVSGHSVGGALLAFAVRSCLKAKMQMEKGPSSIVEATNKILFNDLFQSEQFISLFFAKYDSETKTFLYTNAGHNPPLLFRGDKREPEWLFTHDSLLGIENNITFNEKKSSLFMGDILVLYTDGLTEAHDGGQRRFGTKRLLQAVREAAKKSAPEILNSIVTTWRGFVQSGKPKDDVTLVVFKAIGTR